MKFNILKLSLEQDIAVLTISREEAMNALNTAFFDEMAAMIKELETIPELRVLLLTGVGRAFVAGADIAEMQWMKAAEASSFSRKGQAVFRALEQMKIPVIAVINGYALGGGLELAMSCDFRIAGSEARFGQPETNLGLIPGFAGTQRLARLSGLGNALWLLMTAEIITADEALRIGLVQKVFRQESLMKEALNLAKTIASNGPLAVKRVKAVTRQGLEMEFEQGAEMESRKFGSLFGEGSQGEKGMQAFLKKEKAKWD